jgi:hypothetical protein
MEVEMGCSRVPRVAYSGERLARNDAVAWRNLDGTSLGMSEEGESLGCLDDHIVAEQ